MAPSLAHQNMIDGTLKPSKVLDPILLNAFIGVERGRYLPTWAQAFAYSDAPFIFKEGHPMMAPQVLGLLLQAMKPEAGRTILVVGSTTGYTCALLRHMGLSVVGLESDEDLYNQAIVLQDASEKKQCKFVRGGFSDGLMEWAPYDYILFEGAIAGVPVIYRDQLKKGGTLGAVFQVSSKEGHGCLFYKTKEGLVKEPIFEVTQSFLKGFNPETKFRFC